MQAQIYAKRKGLRQSSQRLVSQSCRSLVLKLDLRAKVMQNGSMNWPGFLQRLFGSARKEDELASPPGDKRKNLRAELVVEKVNEQQRVRTLFGYATNISKSGMFIHTENPKQAGEQFELSFVLPPPVDQQIRCHCEVVWQRMHQADRSSYIGPPAGMGLRFLDLPEKTASRIAKWVQSDL